MQEKIKFKSIDGRRYTILSINVSSRGGGKAEAFIVCENNDLQKELFNFVINVDRFVLIKTEDKIVPMVDKFLRMYGLKLVRTKINERDFESKKIELTDNDLKDIDAKIAGINNSKEVYQERKRVQREILAALYNQEGLGATPWQIMSLVWCDSQLLAQELFHFDKNGKVSAPAIRHERFDEEEEEKDEQRRRNRMIYLMPPGKAEFEKIMEAEHDILSNEVFGGWVPFASNNKVFLAHRFKETGLIDKLKKKLIEVDLTCTEGKVEDLGYITEDIIHKIKSSGFFLALITPQKQYKDEKFSTSSWILMEIGVAIGFGRKVALLVEETIDASDYDGKLQRDCQYEVFDRDLNFDKKLDVIINRIKNERDKSSTADVLRKALGVNKI